MKHPLHIAFVWHMHQPYYKDLLTKESSMPWVRLHGIKDYLDMAKILESFPKIHQTFNLVPSLIEQIQDYSQENAVKDKFLEVSMEKAKDLKDEEKAFILLNFFTANWESMIFPMPRFYDLLIKRGRYISEEQVYKIIKRFTEQDFLDLQVLYNLAWFDPEYKKTIPEIKELVKKGFLYTEEEKKVVLDTQIEILKKIIPEYKRLQEKGLIEVSVSPYFHPILPLVCNTNIARVAVPKMPLPKKFSHPEDAQWQVENAVSMYKKNFGTKPRGMWPSEGSVSEDMVPILIKNGIEWFATDEEILYRSLDVKKSGELLYKPYLLEREGGKASIIFRDRALSDLIGFNYTRISAQDAVSDFMKHLNNIKNYFGKADDARLVSVILDGENCWEFYKNDGKDFLCGLYEEITKDPDLKAVTVSEFLQEYPAKDKIDKLFPGSWINGNYAIWIGHEEKNRAWDCLNQARQDLIAYQEENPKEKDSQNLKLAWKHIYIAEGSDWNWWYGDDHSSDYDDEFDDLYRTHLSNMYTLIGKPIPEYLKTTIRTEKVTPAYEPVGLFTPVIDGKITNYYEWISAGFLDLLKVGGTMHQSQGLILDIFYGFDKDNFYLRVDLDMPKEENDINELKLLVDFSKEKRLEIPFSELLNKPIKAPFYKVNKDGTLHLKKEIETVAFEKILEIGLPLELLEKKHGDEIEVSFIIKKEDAILQTCPSHGPIIIKVPPKDFDSIEWSA